MAVLTLIHLIEPYEMVRVIAKEKIIYSGLVHYCNISTAYAFAPVKKIAIQEDYIALFI